MQASSGGATNAPLIPAFLVSTQEQSIFSALVLPSHSSHHAVDSTVLLLHGLGRTARSMALLGRRIERAGFATVSVDYPSTCHAIETLARDFVYPAFERAARNGPVHFVTHSLGGVLVRALAAEHGIPDTSRVVMVAPPNAGNELADLFHDRWPLDRLCGPALTELQTEPEGIVARLGPIDFELGVIAGDRNMYPGLGRVLGSPNDGRVSVASTKVEGMTDFAVVHAGHALIMRHTAVADQAIHFLRHGRFRNDKDE